MPMYEYQCRKCGEKFEQLQASNGTDKLPKCPKCGDKKPERLMSSFSNAGRGDSVTPMHFG